MKAVLPGISSRLRLAVGLVGVIVVVSSGSLGPGSSSARAQAVNADAAATILQFFDAINHQDVDAFSALFADDAFMIRGAAQGSCSLTAPCYDRDAIGAVVLTAPPHDCETVTSIEVNGSIVTARFEVRHDVLRARGIERVVASLLAEVRDGVIYSYFARADLSDAQTALGAAIAAGAAQSLKPIPMPNPPCG